MGESAHQRSGTPQALHMDTRFVRVWSFFLRVKGFPGFSGFLGFSGFCDVRDTTYKMGVDVVHVIQKQAVERGVKGVLQLKPCRRGTTTCGILCEHCGVNGYDTREAGSGVGTLIFGDPLITGPTPS
jgi:hypothetical protein